MIVIEMVMTAAQKKKPNPEASSRVMKATLSSGLLTFKAGLYDNCIHLHSPLSINDDHLEKGLDILEKTLKKA